MKKSIIFLLILCSFIFHISNAIANDEIEKDFLFKLNDSWLILYVNKLNNSKKHDVIDKLSLYFSQSFLISNSENCHPYEIQYTAFNNRERKINEKISSALNKSKNNLLLRYRFSFYKIQNQESIDHSYFSANTAWYQEVQSHSGEFIGNRSYIWLLPPWGYVEKEISKTKKEIMFSANLIDFLYRANLTSNKSFNLGMKENLFLLIDTDSFNQILQLEKSFKLKEKPYYINTNLGKWNDLSKAKIKQMLIQSSQPINSDTYITANIPIMLVDEKNHKNRADSEDWRIYTYVNSNNGDFFQYFLFDPEKELNMPWPLYIRDFAMDYLAGTHICKYSTVAVMKKSHEKVVKHTKYGFTPELIRIAKINDKQWRPAPVPKDKNTIPKNRLFFEDNPGRIFGSYAKIWDLKIWFEVPRMLRENPEGVYLVGYGSLLQLADTHDPIVEQKLLSECGILITPTLYKQLESLRKSFKSKKQSKQ